MSRAKIFCWVFIAFCTVIAGVNMAYEANVGMTGANNIERPFEYSVVDNTIDIVFLGKTYYIIFPRAEVGEIKEQVKYLTRKTVRRADVEVRKIYSKSREKVRNIKGELADI